MLRKIISILLTISFILTQSLFAQGVAELNIGQYLNRIPALSPNKFRPVHLRYFSYDAAVDGFKILLDKGDVKDIKDKELESQANTLMQYFLIGISLPNDRFWVNLRPDAQDQIIDEFLERTDIGRIILEADLQLKKDTASFTSPKTQEGREYWDRLYKKAGELFGNENIAIPTVTRPWIVPSEVLIHYTEDSAYVYKATLKVMLEQDYLKDSAVYNFEDERLKKLNEYSSELIRELIIPKLTKGVNTAKRYAQLRQVFYSLALAQWFKDKFKGTSGQYARMIDSQNLSGLETTSTWSKTAYFRAYQKSFKNGEYNIKEPVNSASGQVIRSYVSGGVVGDTTSVRSAIPGNASLTGVLERRLIDPQNYSVLQEDSRGFDGLPNDAYTEDIKRALEDKNFASCRKITDKYFLQDTFSEDVYGAKIEKGEQKIILYPAQLKTLNEVIASMGIGQELEDTTLIFIKGQKAHYGLGRNQVYLDTALLDNPDELREKLYHEITERMNVLWELENLYKDYYLELKRYPANPEMRSHACNAVIEKLAKENHKRLEKSAPALAVSTLRDPQSMRDGIAWAKKNKYIFGGGFGYDIRINDAESDAASATKFFYVLGRVFGQKYLQKIIRTALITGDQRSTSRAFRLALVQGLLDEGVEVTTQADNEAITSGLPSRKGLADDSDLVVQITGSHNPPKANGAKISLNSLPFFGEQLTDLEKLLTVTEANNIFSGNMYQGALIVSKDLVPEHIEELVKILPDIQNPVSLIVDARHGAGGSVFTGLAKEKGYSVILLNSVDDSLPDEVFMSNRPVLLVLNYRPSPLMEAGIWDPSKPEAFDEIKKLQQRIYSDDRFKGKKFGGGVFDGDGDRSGALTEGDKGISGQLIMPERMLVSYFQRMILENMGGIKALNRLGHTVKLALDVRASGVIIDILKNLSKKYGIKVEGEFIAAGFPNHRSFVLEELTAISNLSKDNNDYPELTEEDRAAIKKLMLSYTSAEASGHFFFNVLSPDQFLNKKIVVDDGITSFFMYLYLIDTLDTYELEGQSNVEKTFRKADDLFPLLPVTNEVRLEKAPAEVAKKQEFAEEIMKQFAKDNPQLLPMSLDKFVQKVEVAKNNPPKRQNANEDLLLVDGIRLRLRNGIWILLRKSNTSAVLGFKAEAESNDKKIELLKVLRLFAKAIDTVKANSVDFQGLETKKFAEEVNRLEEKFGVSSAVILQKKYSDAQVDFKGIPFEDTETLGMTTAPNVRLATAYAEEGEKKEYPALDPSGNPALHMRFGYKDAENGALRNTYVKAIEEWARAVKQKGAKVLLHFGIGGQGMSNSAQADFWGQSKDVKILVLDRFGVSMKKVFDALIEEGYTLSEIVISVSSKSGGTDEPLGNYQQAFDELLKRTAMERDYSENQAVALVRKFSEYFKKLNKEKKKNEELFGGIDKATIEREFFTTETQIIKKVLGQLVFTTSNNIKASRLFAFATAIKRLFEVDIPIFDFSEYTGGRYTENSESGLVTQAFQGLPVGRDRAELIEQANQYLGEKGNNPAENSAFMAALVTRRIDPSAIVVAVRSSNALSEALQKQQLFPESNGKNGQGAWVVTAVGQEELNRKVGDVIIQTGMAPLVIIVDYKEGTYDLAPLRLDNDLAKVTPFMVYEKEDSSYLSNTKFALWFQEFTVRYGLLSAADMAEKRKVNLRIPRVGASKMNEIVIEGESNLFAVIDPQNQRFVELAKKALAKELEVLAKDIASARKRYGHYEERIGKGSYLLDEEINIAATDNSRNLSHEEMLSLLNEDKEVLDEASNQIGQYSDKRIYDDSEIVEVINKIKALKEENKESASHQQYWIQQVKDPSGVAMVQRNIERNDKEIKTLYKSISGFGLDDTVDAGIKEAARKIASLELLAYKRKKIISPVFYTSSENADTLGEALALTDFGIGTRDQHANFEHRLGGKDVVFNLLVDIVTKFEDITKNQDRLISYGLANAYLDGMYPDEVRRWYLRKEFEALSGVVGLDVIGPDGTIIKDKRIYRDVAIALLPDISTDTGLVTALRIFNRAHRIFQEARKTLAEKQAKNASSAVVSREIGGVDFTSINMITKARVSKKIADFTMNGARVAERINLFKENSALMKLMDTQILPSEDRIMDYVARTCVQDVNKEAAQACMVDYFRLQEEFVVEATPELKEFLNAISPFLASDSPSEETIETDV